MKAIMEYREGSWIVGGPAAGQPEYHPLEVVRGQDGTIWSAWRPSLWEYFGIMLGAPIRIGILSEKQPPIIVTLQRP